MYKLLLVAPDGDFVTDRSQDTVEECCKQSADMGSRWFFYPFHFIIKDKGKIDLNQRVIEPPDQLDFLKGKSLRNAIEHVKACADMYLQ